MGKISGVQAVKVVTGAERARERWAAFLADPSVWEDQRGAKQARPSVPAAAATAALPKLHSSHSRYLDVMHSVTWIRTISPTSRQAWTSFMA